MYPQTRFGLPVWHGGVAIHKKTGIHYRSQSTRHTDLDDLKKPSKVAMTRLKKLNKTALAKALNLAKRTRDVDAKTLVVQRVRLLIYRFKAERRELLEDPSESGKFGHKHPTIPLPPVPKSIKQDKHYVSAEVQFALALKGQATMNWTAIIEAETLAVLYLRAFVDNVNGMVFREDPMTNNGGPAPNANSRPEPHTHRCRAQGLVAPVAGTDSGGQQSSHD
jgi:hypothetical protein